ncbi:MAG: hypothetical protein N3A53_02185 [Verrucomicrobiae bacterium]|nr:hypothetical protein [Verrucomicrobiae bacterium]
MMAWSKLLIAAVVLLCAVAYPARTFGDSLPAPAGVPEAPPITEADRFFNEFARAAEFLARGSRQQAWLVMDQLRRRLQTSPWMELALLKACELAETQNEAVAMEGYQLLRSRVTHAPWFQASRERTTLFAVAIHGAVDRGIARIRLARIRDGLGRYFARYGQYPESLAKLAIFNYVAPEDIQDANGRPFRYLPTGMQMRPTITYLRYEIESLPAEVFVPTAPKLEGITRIQEDPPRYAALIRVPGRAEPARVVEEQTTHGYYAAAITARGAVFVGGGRVLTLPAP